VGWRGLLFRDTADGGEIVDELRELFELWFDRTGRVASVSPPLGATERDMEMAARVTEVIPALFADTPTDRIQLSPDSEKTAYLMPAWFGGTE
jgi:hypothetical protein